MDELRVLVVAGDPLARAGLAALLDDLPDCRVVGQLAAGDQLAGEAALYRPDVVLWDLGWDPALPAHRGRGATGALAAHHRPVIPHQVRTPPNKASE